MGGRGIEIRKWKERDQGIYSPVPSLLGHSLQLLTGGPSAIDHCEQNSWPLLVLSGLGVVSFQVLGLLEQSNTNWMA